MFVFKLVCGLLHSRDNKFELITLAPCLVKNRTLQPEALKKANTPNIPARKSLDTLGLIWLFPNWPKAAAIMPDLVCRPSDVEVIRDVCLALLEEYGDLIQFSTLFMMIQESVNKHVTTVFNLFTEAAAQFAARTPEEIATNPALTPYLGDIPRLASAVEAWPVTFAAIFNVFAQEKLKLHARLCTPSMTAQRSSPPLVFQAGTKLRSQAGASGAPSRATLTL